MKPITHIVLNLFAISSLLASLSLASLCFAETPPKYQPIKYGDFEQWVVREIKESRMVGGEWQTMYAIGKTDTVKGEVAFNDKTSPWASSNVYADIKGLVTTTSSVYPYPHKGGSCALVETSTKEMRVLGMIDIKIITAGAIYLGKIHEPIKKIKNPFSNITMGIPFTQKPKALVLDYRTNLNTDGILIEASGADEREYKGTDPAQAFVLLQHRWEDEKGNVYAKRIATASKLFKENTDNWSENFKIPLKYGNDQLEGEMPLLTKISSMYYTRNSKGKMTIIQEEETFAEEGLQPTHIIVFISSGSQGEYKGALGSQFFVDNIRFEL